MSTHELLIAARALTEIQADILRHALQPDRGRMRGLYVEDQNDPACTAMVAAGYLKPLPPPFPMGGSIPFRVTDAGEEALAEFDRGTIAATAGGEQ